MEFASKVLCMKLTCHKNLLRRILHSTVIAGVYIVAIIYYVKMTFIH